MWEFHYRGSLGCIIGRLQDAVKGFAAVENPIPDLFESFDGEVKNKTQHTGSDNNDEQP
jgi:hypothetical protein